MRKTVRVNEGDAKYNELVSFADKISDENLLIVARGEGNRKDNAIHPLSVKNGIYFYVAHDVGGALVYKPEYTPQEVEIAKANTIANARIGNLFDVMMGSGRKVSEWVCDDEPMNVLTNEEKSNGAGILFCSDFIQEMFNKVGDFYILPSSIHELIIVPKKNVDAGIDELSAMVRKINAGIVTEEEKLADEGFEVSAWM